MFQTTVFEKIKGDGQCLNNTNFYRHVSFLRTVQYQETALMYQMINSTLDYVKTKSVNSVPSSKKYTS
jgi:hypothetical protein